MTARGKTVSSLMLVRTLAVTLLTLAAMGPLAAHTAHAEELPPGGTFLDDDGNVHEGYIEAIAAEGITHGCSRSGDHYCPSESVTRGQMAAFLRRALGLPASSTDHFADDDGHLFEGDINALAEAGITKGCGNATEFCPDGDVTRGQMAAFLRRARELPAASTDYFADDDGHLFEGDINAIAAEGITKGCNPPDNTAFCPGDKTQRDQMASFLGRALGLTPTRPPERDPSTMSVEDSIRAWFSDIYDQAYSVADCESNLDPEAYNPNGYHGLFQIGDGHSDAFTRVTGQSWSEVYTAYYNAQYARWLYDQSNSWQQWGCKP